MPRAAAAGAADAAGGAATPWQVWRVPALVFVLALLVTGALAVLAGRALDAQDRARFETDAARTVAAMRERIATIGALLDGAAGLFAADDDVDVDEFSAFVQRMDLRRRYPGILGLGFSRRIAPGEVAQVESALSAQRGEPFAVWPPGPREEFHSIVFIEPLDQRNRAALGYDMYGEATRRAAMAAARDAGQARATARVTLVQEIDPEKQAGLLVYLPVYRGGAVPGEVAQRRERLLGFVYTPLRVDDLLEGARGPGSQLDYELYDGALAVPGQLLRSTAPAAAHTPRFVVERTMEVAGRPWLVRFRTGPAFESQSARFLRPWLALLAVSTSVLLAFITLVQGRARRAAEAASARQRLAADTLRAREEALREVDRRKDEFLATLAHELRNPLAPIRTSLEIIRRAPASPAAAHAVDVAQRQTRHMVRLIDDLLDVSRISRGAVVMRREPVALKSVLEAAVETSRPFIESRAHRLVADPVDPAIVLLADATRLAQVFGNLLHNAATYTDPGGTIEIRHEVDAARRQVQVHVRDTGIGIEPHMLTRVFDLFTQAERPGGTGGGLGIGLTLVRSLVGLHGGTVEARSDGPGCGATFDVCLPVVDAPAGPVPASESGAPQPAQAPRSRVLVVDDNRDAAESLAVMLAADGHEVRTVNDGPAAVEAARSDPPDVVVLDIGMPGMDGYEVARELRRTPQGGRLRLIALTGRGQPDDRRRAAEAGFDLHMVKPVDYAMLAQQLSMPTSLPEPPP